MTRPFVDDDVPDETDETVDALSGVCKGPPTDNRLDPASYR